MSIYIPEVDFDPQPYVDPSFDFKPLVLTEQQWQTFYKEKPSGYVSQKGKKNPAYGGGWTLSEETKQKMRQAKLGKKLTQSHKDKIGSHHKGKVNSEETRKKMSESQKGKTWKMSDRGKKNVSESLKGKKLSLEHKKQISQGMKKKWKKKNTMKKTSIEQNI
jgi:hypothetical protein